VRDGLDDVARAGLAFGTDHRGTFGNAAESFTQVTAAADEGYFEGGFVDVIDVVGWSEDFGFVDVVDADGLENLESGSSCQHAFAFN
jgi:hypothetical protein